MPWNAILDWRRKRKLREMLTDPRSARGIRSIGQLEKGIGSDRATTDVCCSELARRRPQRPRSGPWLFRALPQRWRGPSRSTGPSLDGPRQVMRWTMAGFYTLAGVVHITAPDKFLSLERSNLEPAVGEDFQYHRRTASRVR